MQPSEADLASESTSAACYVALVKLPDFCEPGAPVLKWEGVPPCCEGGNKDHHEVLGAVCS